MRSAKLSSMFGAPGAPAAHDDVRLTVAQQSVKVSELLAQLQQQEKRVADFWIYFIVNRVRLGLQ